MNQILRLLQITHTFHSPGRIFDRIAILFIILMLPMVSLKAEIRLPSILADGAVLQRNTELTLEGWADPGERVTLTFRNKNYKTRTGHSGKWSISLPPQEAGGPYTMTFKGKNRITLQNIMIGDVWLCAGQSNMVLPMERVKEKYPDEIAAAQYPAIRHFFIPTTINLQGPAADLPEGEWKEANPEDVLSFSAVAYFFARKVYEKYGIPIGLVNASVGGTPIEAWTSEEGFAGMPAKLQIIERNKDPQFIDSINNLPRPPRPESQDKGLLENPKWYDPAYTPKGWHTINIPGYWEDQGVKNLNGVVWYRREIDVPASMTGAPAKLFMGRIIDADHIYVNGEEVGHITYQYPPRRYTIPAGLLKPGKNTIVIRVQNFGGKGGFVPDKPYFLTANGEEIDLMGTWQYKVGDVFAPQPRGGFYFSAQNQPTALYNAMVAPVTWYKVKGFLWYQGESNGGRPGEYEELLKGLIADWRAKWDDPSLPFLFVQLANYMDVNYLPEESNWAELRFGQFKALEVPKTAMAVTIDLGEWNDIHPLNKKDVGERLALGAMKLVYGEEIVHTGPLYRSAERIGNKMVLSFDGVGSGLTTNDGEPLRRFEIAGQDGRFVWAEANIRGDKVEVWSENIDHPVRARYAWSDNPRDANFYNLDGLPASPFEAEALRSRISLNEGWKFYRYPDPTSADSLIYDVRPPITDNRDFRPADEKPTEAAHIESTVQVLKPWIMPTGNQFITDPAGKYQRPEGDPGKDFPFIQASFDDKAWETLDLPHDWAITEPFYEGWNAEVSGGMGRLPSHGVAWYLKKLDIPVSDAGKKIFLDIDGAMSYAMVWINGHLAGGWPYGYASFRVDLTPYIKPGGTNQLAIRLDNPNHSSRWYPGGGIYRNVWLTKTAPVHIGHWGTSIATKNVTDKKADIHLDVTIANDSKSPAEVMVRTAIYALDNEGSPIGEATITWESEAQTLEAGATAVINTSASIENPKLWGPPPQQEPNMYTAATTLLVNEKETDNYSTPFGIREVETDPEKGVFVNGEHFYLQGVNQHHDLGALGAAFNVRAAERQLEVLREMGCNAIRMAHNPPAPELLELTDRMGFIVIDEIFDSWERKKTPHDFHLIFPEWHEQDVRAFIRRDRNHPSVIMWSLGNEVGEQYTGEAGVAVAEDRHDIARQEDPTRPTTISMNFAKPPMTLPGVMDVINLNYQGEGIRNAPAYSHLKGINTAPLYPSFHEAHPDKLIISSENAAALSSRGEYIFPVTNGISAPAEAGSGIDTTTLQVSSYELYTAPFGSSADKVFRSLAQHPYVGGGFVWSGWDYLGEPTPFYQARSSYYGVIDLAGFPKDRFYLYQAHWRPDHPMVHIIPHWNWPERKGEVTPVHVFTSGDAVELFLNGRSLGKKKKGPYEYRLRWDDVRYETGELKAVAYKGGEKWAEQSISTTGKPSGLKLTADRQKIRADGKDLVFVTVQVVDSDGREVPDADPLLEFSVTGPGTFVAADNGDPTDMTAFPAEKRKAFNGKALVILKGEKNNPGQCILNVKSEGLEAATITIRTGYE